MAPVGIAMSLVAVAPSATGVVEPGLPAPVTPGSATVTLVAVPLVVTWRKQRSSPSPVGWTVSPPAAAALVVIVLPAAPICWRASSAMEALLCGVRSDLVLRRGNPQRRLNGVAAQARLARDLPRGPDASPGHRQCGGQQRLARRVGIGRRLLRPLADRSQLDRDDDVDRKSTRLNS